MVSAAFVAKRGQRGCRVRWRGRPSGQRDTVFKLGTELRIVGLAAAMEYGTSSTASPGSVTRCAVSLRRSPDGDTNLRGAAAMRSPETMLPQNVRRQAPWPAGSGRRTRGSTASPGGHGRIGCAAIGGRSRPGGGQAETEKAAARRIVRRDPARVYRERAGLRQEAWLRVGSVSGHDQPEWERDLVHAHAQYRSAWPGPWIQTPTPSTTCWRPTMPVGRPGRPYPAQTAGEEHLWSCAQAGFALLAGVVGAAWWTSETHCRPRHARPVLRVLVRARRHPNTGWSPRACATASRRQCGTRWPPSRHGFETVSTGDNDRHMCR